MLSKITGLFTGMSTTFYMIIAALLFGTAFGAYVSNKFHKAKLADQYLAKIESDAKSIEASNKIAEKVIEEVNKVENDYLVRNKEIVRYVPKTVYKECKASDGNVVDTTLDARAVSLLNGTDSTNIQPTASDDAKSKTPTEVGLQELSTYILTIKQLYEELAIQHNGLVDYNSEYKTLINQ